MLRALVRRMIGRKDVGGRGQSLVEFAFILPVANGNSCNGNSSGIREIINQNGIPTVVDLGDDIGPLNSGNHTDLFDAMNRWIGAEFPVSIVDDEGNMVGWATFHLTSIEGSSDKVMGGYFVSPINPSSLSIVPGGGTGDGYGSYVIRLDE